MAKTVDFTGSVDPFAPIDAGVYLVEVAKATIKSAGENAKHPGSEYVAVEFTIQSEKETGDEQFKGRKVWLNMSMHNDPQVLGSFKRNIQALGEEPGDSEYEFDENNLVGRQCFAVVTVGKNPKTDEANNSVKRIMALDEEASILP